MYMHLSETAVLFLKRDTRLIPSMILSDRAVIPASSSAVGNQSIIESSWWLTYVYIQDEIKHAIIIIIVADGPVQGNYL